VTTTQTLAPRSSAPPSGRTILAVVVTLLAWASAFVAIRGVGEDFSPGALALGRLLVGTAVLGLLLAGRGWVRPTGREWALLVVCGVGWFGIYNVSLNAAEQHLDAGTTAMLVNIGPILIAVFAGLLLGEGFPRWLVAGIAVAFAGVVLIGVATRGAETDVLGVVLCVVAAVTYAIGVVAQKPLLRRLPALQVTFTACAIGAI
jgi:drug/metabolite transporter (DMT)-like permease